MRNLSIYPDSSSWSRSIYFLQRIYGRCNFYINIKVKNVLIHFTYFDKSILVMLSLCFRYWDKMKMSSEYRPDSRRFNCISWSVLMSWRGIKLPLMASCSTRCSKTNLAKYFRLNSFILEFLKLINFGITLWFLDAWSSNLSQGKIGCPIICLSVGGV